LSLKSPGSLLYQLGATHNELAGSHYLEHLADPALFQGTTIPRVNVPRALTLMKALGAAIRQGLVRACHDLSEGGLAVAAAEMSLAGVLTPRRIASGVVNGVRDYGNKMGIPTVNGAILYHPSYIYNPLVFCGCLGPTANGIVLYQISPCNPTLFFYKNKNIGYYL
jgi:phosphoribosylformylglycinamidine (FGAM) synthase-like enzyme